MSEIKVTQVDRDAAARLIGGELGWYRRPAIQEGREDNSTFVQAFAAHRQAAMIEGARRMRAAAANVCGSLAETTYDDADGFAAATGCEAAILALDPASVVGE